MKMLPKYHKRSVPKVYKRLSGKISNLMSSLKVRALEAGVEFDVTSEEVRKLLYDSYGTKCKYCGVKIIRLDKANPISCDHIVPLQKGGASVVSNLQFICSSCNRRKSSLTEADFLHILKWIGEQNEEIKKHMLFQMAKGGF